MMISRETISGVLHELASGFRTWEEPRPSILFRPRKTVRDSDDAGSGAADVAVRSGSSKG